MSAEVIINNLLSPPILFYFAGMLAILIKSDLEFPQPLPKLFSLYLLFAIGLKGGASLAKSGADPVVLATMLAAVLLSCIVPFYTYFYLRLRMDVFNAAAVAGTYGSISAVTFITASAFLESSGAEFGGHMVAAMALMEAPAIIAALVLVGLFAERRAEDAPAREESGFLHILKDAFSNGSVFLLLASLAIGMVAEKKGMAKLEPFTEEIFYGVLCLFLLDMGLVSASRIAALRKAGAFAVLSGLAMPLFNAGIGIGVCALLDALAGPGAFPRGDALLLVVLAASASYIAAPAALRLVLPEANPGLYVPMSLAITFPLNIIVGIPLYYFLLGLLGIGDPG